MKRAFTASSIAILAALVMAIGCRSADTSKSETQRQFGVRMAKMNLWREAMFRFRRAVEISPDDAMAHNNLAVALEANGDFEKARREYLEALKLDKGNSYIQKNYSRFTEFLQRNKKRQQRAGEAKPATTPKGATAAQPVAIPPPTPGITEPAMQPPPSLLPPAPQPPSPKPPGGSR